MKNILVFLLGFLLVSYVDAQVNPPPERAQTEISEKNSILPWAIAIVESELMPTYVMNVQASTNEANIAIISYVTNRFETPDKIPRVNQGSYIYSNSVSTPTIAINTISAIKPFQYQRGRATFGR